jgi:outer membrane protein OmpA-like peptidoglycan-associated protein
MVNLIILSLSTLFASSQTWALCSTLKVELDRHQSHLRSEQKEQINDFLSHYHNQSVYITGHSEDGGSSQYNLILSYQRAQNALEQVTLNQVPKSKIHTQGAGSNRNQAPGSLLVNNRYIEINLMEEPL